MRPRKRFGLNPTPAGAPRLLADLVKRPLPREALPAAAKLAAELEELALERRAQQGSNDQDRRAAA